MKLAKAKNARVLTTDAQIDVGIREARAYERAGGAKVVAARFVPERDVVSVSLNTGARIEVPRKALPQLRFARPKELSRVEIGPAGGLVWFQPADTGMDLEELLIIAIGEPLLETFGARAMGSISTPKKAAAARSNGKRGGRPRNSAPAKRAALK